MLILVAMLSMVQAESQSEWPVLVERKEFNCLATAIAKMPADRTIYVDIRKCPSARIENAYPWVPPESDSKTPRRILRLLPEQSACLRNNRRSLSRIARPIGSDRYLVDLAACQRP